MGVKAWAQGRDVYFGKGGFDPKVAVHELVHTVQQGSVKGTASVSMPLAYSIFAAYTGDPGGRFKDRYKNIKVDMTLFKNKLKNMARVVTDYPELKNMIGDMKTIDPKGTELMATIGTRGGERKATFDYYKRQDKDGIFADPERDIEDKEEKKNPFHSSPRDYHGTHEMGHVLASLLV